MMVRVGVVIGIASWVVVSVGSSVRLRWMRRPGAALAAAVAGDGDVNRAGAGRAQLPCGGGGGVAEHRAVAGRHHGRHPAPLARHHGVADGVHAVIQAVQPADAGAEADRRVAEPERQQLPASDDAVLSGRECRDLRVRGA
jgi:hypothetical protein